MSNANNTVHVITPEGQEVISREASWLELPADYRSMACAIPCTECSQEPGDRADHPANG